MTPIASSLYEGIRSRKLASEQFTELLSAPGLRVARIVSDGHTTPESEWYDQETGELVFVIQGVALVLFEASGAEVSLVPGDYVNIAPHERHRVTWTDLAQKTVWLVIHYDASRDE